MADIYEQEENYKESNELYYYITGDGVFYLGNQLIIKMGIR